MKRLLITLLALSLFLSACALDRSMSGTSDSSSSNRVTTSESDQPTDKSSGPPGFQDPGDPQTDGRCHKISHQDCHIMALTRMAGPDIYQAMRAHHCSPIDGWLGLYVTSYGEKNATIPYASAIGQCGKVYRLYHWEWRVRSLDDKQWQSLVTISNPFTKSDQLYTLTPWSDYKDWAHLVLITSDYASSDFQPRVKAGWITMPHAYCGGTEYWATWGAGFTPGMTIFPQIAVGWMEGIGNPSCYVN